MALATTTTGGAGLRATRQHANTPHANTPTRQHANTPTRQHANTPAARVPVVRAVRLEEDVERVVAQRAGKAQVFAGELHRLQVQELAGREDLAEAALRGFEDVEHVFVRVGAQEGDVDGLRARGRLDGDLGDEAQASFGTDEHLLQVVPGVIFAAA